MAPVRTATNVITGYANIYIAPTGTTAPANTIALGGAWAAGWVSAGYTNDGLEFEHNVDTEDIEVEEEGNPVDIIVNRKTINVNFSLAEDVMENMQFAYGGGTLTTVPAATGVIGTKTLALSDTLTRVMLGFEARNTFGFYRRVILPTVLSTGSVSTSYKRNDKRLFPVSFRYVGAASAITIVEQTGAALP